MLETICNHHHVAPSVRISQTFSRHPSLSSFARSTSCIGTELLYVDPSWTPCLCSSTWRGPQKYVNYEFVLTSPVLSRTSGSSLIAFVMGGKWPYSCCFVKCCFQFNIARSILAKCPSSFFSIRFVSFHVVHPYSSIDTTAAWKKTRFILSVRYDFHMTDSLLVAVHAFISHVLMSVFVDETLLPR